MKNVQISQELFMSIMKYFLLGQEEFRPEIEKGLEQKLDAMVKRELYTKYKTAPTEEEKEEVSGQGWYAKGFQILASLPVINTGACHAPVNSTTEIAVWRCDNGVTDE
jgi:hypothetical protein